jgi:ureidoacrylate peracid hydrolase
MKTALIIIDCQNDFIKGHSSYECEMLDRYLIDRIKKLILFARKRNLPIIYTQHSIKPDKSNVEFGEPEDIRVCIEGTQGWKIIDELKQRKEEYVIKKDKYDAFVNTELEALLKKLKIDTVILAGVLTNNCVRATAEGAHYRNFKIIVVSDCTGATSCNKGLTSKKVHELTLEDLKGRMYETEILSFRKLEKLF